MKLKCKKCPSCGSVNQISNIVCGVCGEDLLRVPVVTAKEGETFAEGAGEGSTTAAGESYATATKESPAMAAKEDPATKGAEPELSYGRICPDCGKKWPYQQRKCDCGKNLFTVAPTSFTEEAKAGTLVAEKETVSAVAESSRYLLRSEDGRCHVELRDGAQVILGRTGVAANYLSFKGFVSKEHLKIRRLGEEIVIEHIGSTNPTLVNGVELRRGEPYPVKEGDLISLGVYPGQEVVDEAAYFRVVREIPQE